MQIHFLKIGISIKKFIPYIFAASMFLLLAHPLFSQDLITFRDGKKLECEITKVDNYSIYYNFFKNERKVSSFARLSEIESYRKNYRDTSENETDGLFPENDSHTVIVDTTRYVKEVQKWINMVTYAHRFGINSNGWSVQYYGFNFKSTARWYIPIVIGFENSSISDEYFADSGYNSMSLGYANIGISPFYMLNENFFLNLEVQFHYGQEELQDFSGNETNRTIFGISPSQGIYFIPKSNFGLTVGVSVFERLLSSKVYKNDFGVKLELGIKF